MDHELRGARPPALAATCELMVGAKLCRPTHAATDGMAGRCVPWELRRDFRALLNFATSFLSQVRMDWFCSTSGATPYLQCGR